LEKLAVPGAVAVLVGWLLGRAPVINTHLHFNLYMILPVGGFLVSAALAWIAFQVARALEIPTHGQQVQLGLAACCVLGFAATDYGVYQSTDLPRQLKPDAPVTMVHAADVMSFSDYMAGIRLGASKLKLPAGFKLDAGSEVTTGVYVMDLLGAAGGAWAMLFLMATGLPFCEKCGKYKKPAGSLTIIFRDEDEVKNGHLSIKANLEKGYEAAIAWILRLRADQAGVNSGRYRMHFQELVCAVCSECTLVSTVEKRTGEDWDELTAKKFTATSPVGLGPKLTV